MGNTVRTDLRDSILGGQDGLVNVLGVILAVATATNDPRIVIIAGLAATFAESVSMAAVGYTSSKAALDFYKGEFEKHSKNAKDPVKIRRIVREIYYHKGFRGKLLDGIVKSVSSDKKKSVETILREKDNLTSGEYNPLKSAWVVGLSAIIGSLIPLLPFFFVGISSAMMLSIIISTASLFAAGTVKAKLTRGNWLISGIEMAAIGMFAALIGYGIGAVLGVAIA